MTEQYHPERDAAEKSKYYPPGHKKSVANLRANLNAAIDVRMLSEGLPADVQTEIDNVVFDGVAITVDDPVAAAYLAAVQLERDCRLAIYKKEDIALQYLKQLAAPLMHEPPADVWGSVEIIAETGISTLQVPFTRPELAAISAARDARQQLALVAAQQSGAEREFLTESNLFPTEAQETPFSRGLTSRPSAIWGIMTAACAAEDALTNFVGSAWEPRGASVGQLVIIRDLPDNLIRHKPSPAK